MIFGSPAEDVSVERGDPVRLDFEVRSPLADSQISGDSIVKIRDQMMEIDVSSRLPGILCPMSRTCCPGRRLTNKLVTS